MRTPPSRDSTANADKLEVVKKGKHWSKAKKVTAEMHDPKAKMLLHWLKKLADRRRRRVSAADTDIAKAKDFCSSNPVAQ
jgi:hypothetical protein